MISDQNTKRYIGDSVYAEFKDQQIILTTENLVPFDPSNMIVIDSANEECAKVKK